MAATRVKIMVPGNHLMAGLLGERDELLRLIEDAFGDTAVHVRGNEISLDGPEASDVGRLFEELVLLLQSVLMIAVQVLRADRDRFPQAVRGVRAEALPPDCRTQTARERE